MYARTRGKSTFTILESVIKKPMQIMRGKFSVSKENQVALTTMLAKEKGDYKVSL